jgi:ABC-type transport system substrate-binding protein
MSKLAQSGFVMGSLGLIAGISVFNAVQMHNLESITIDNHKRLQAIEKNGVAVSSTARMASGSSDGGCDQECEALKDPDNLLVPRPRGWSNADKITRASIIRTKEGSDPRGLNPYIATGADATKFNLYMNDYLAWPHFDDPSQYFPQLAVKVTSPDDGLTYRVELRKGVYWHMPTVDWDSGQFDWLKAEGPGGRHELTSDDYKFVYDMVENQQIAGRISSLRPYFDTLKEVRVIDRYTFEVEFTERIYTNKSIVLSLAPSPRWLFMYDQDGNRYDDATWGLKLNEHWYNQKGIGVGRYRFVEWDAGVKLEMEANELYWDGPPPFDRHRAIIVKDQNAWPRKLKAGEIDITQLQAEQYATEVKENKTGVYLGNEHIKSDVHDTLGYFYLGWNLDKPMFADKRVRQALTMAFNRQGIVDSIFHGLGEVNSGPFAMQTDCYDTTIEPWPFDLAAATAKLAEAGWTDTDGDGILNKTVNGEKVDFSFTLLMYGSSNEYATLSEVYREDLLSIGIKMTPNAVEWSTMLKKMDEREFDVYTGAWVLSLPTDLMQLWHSKEADKAVSSNRVAFRNKDADRIAEALRVEFDEEKRVQLCHEFHALVHEEQPYTFFYQRRRPVLYWDHMNQPDYALQYPHRDIRHFSFNAEPTRP